MGIPVVATYVGGFPDRLQDGQTGLLIPDDDDEAMAEAVLRLLIDSDLAAGLSMNERKLAQQLAWDQVRPQWDHLFSNVVGAPSHNPYNAPVTDLVGSRFTATTKLDKRCPK